MTSIAYGLVDGMLSSECVQGFPGGYKMLDGTLWFPTTHGVAIVDPRNRDSRPPRVALERTLLDHSVVAADAVLRIAPGQRNLEIEYTALSWGRPQRISFKYRMSGLDPTWVDAGTRRTAYYPYLPPGSYTFTVVADNGEGVWNMEGASLQVTVLPAFYQTGSFFGLLGVAGVGSLGLAWTRRVARWQHTQAAQQAFARQLIASQEGERKRIAGELHDSLGQHLLIITNRAALGKGAAGDPGRVMEQIDEINASTLQAIGEVRTIAQNLRPINLDRLGLTAAIEEMVEKASGAAGVAFSADVGPVDGILAPDDQIVVYRIIQESVNNILKHSDATRGNVEVWSEDAALRISVRDDGRGSPIPHRGRRDRPMDPGPVSSASPSASGFWGARTLSNPYRARAPLSACRSHSSGRTPMERASSDIRVVIADDHPIFRKGLRQILEADRHLAIVGEAADGEQALDLIRTGHPHVAVLDVDMPRKNGLAVAGDVRALGLDVALIFLTMHKNERFFNAALDVGVRGYMLKETASLDIIEGIRAVADGRSYVTPALSDYLINRHHARADAGDGTPVSALTPTERRVLRLVADYKTSKEIADALFISIRTVDRHRANIASKLDLTGAHALLQFAVEHKAEL